MKLRFSLNDNISAQDFVDLLERSGLAQRRPVENTHCIEGMLKHTNLSVSAWQANKLVGIARSVTDFHYACYLSDLAVDSQFQGMGIGRALIDESQKALEDTCKLILLAAPDADSYYEHLGFTRNPRAWVKEST